MQHYGVGSCGFIVPKKEFDRTKNFLKAQQLVKMMNKLTGKQVSKNFISFYLTNLKVIQIEVHILNSTGNKKSDPRGNNWPKCTIRKS